MNPQTTVSLTLPESYPALLENIKTRIRESQVKAAMSVNQELIKLHWWIGSEIVKRQEADGWKAQVIDRLCKDIQSGFPGLKGFSRSNIFYMRRFYISYARIQQAAGFLGIPPDFCLNIPWWHNVILIEKVKNLVEREWYARKAVENGCSRAILGVVQQ
jgi:predicted nuclease of restriction endonuclease-like (RecB) superfamily